MGEKGVESRETNLYRFRNDCRNRDGISGAANLFRESRIDFCCGGGRTLSEALQKTNLDESSFLQKLNGLYDQARKRGEEDNTDWRKLSSSELIDHIVNRHHGYLQRELPLLGEFVTKILRVHGTDHPELAELHRLFHQMKTELEQHLIAEEEVLFPKIRQYESNPSEGLRKDIAQKVEEMEKDHDQVGDALKQIRSITKDYTLPEGACRTYTLAFQKLEELEADVFQHVHLENNILFPRLAGVVNG